MTLRGGYSSSGATRSNSLNNLVIYLLLLRVKPYNFTCRLFSASQRWCSWSRCLTMLITKRRRRTQTAWCPPFWRRCRNWTNTCRNPAAMSVYAISPVSLLAVNTQRHLTLQRLSSGPAGDGAGWGPTSVRPSRSHPPAPGAEHAAECRGAPGAVRLAHRPRPGRRWEDVHHHHHAAARCGGWRVEVDCCSASLDRNGTPEPLRQHHLVSPLKLHLGQTQELESLLSDGTIYYTHPDLCF